MKARDLCGFAALASCTFLLDGCETNLSSAPPITASFLRAGVRQNADGRTLTQGRSLFLNRCIQCHALPDVARFDPPRLTAIVAVMSGRANMNTEQREALLKYLQTVRSQ
jgi:mono/diheme cytochrome c family protein